MIIKQINTADQRLVLGSLLKRLKDLDADLC